MSALHLRTPPLTSNSLVTMDESNHEPELPTADPAKETKANDGQGSDSEDEAAPDFGQLAGLASRAIARQGISANEDTNPGSVFIPKRGEKDFEPTGFAGQSRALENSRKAMFEVISCQRVINSKTISIATWEPSLHRAVVHLSRGQAFTSMGLSRRVPLLQDGQFEDLANAYNKGPDPLPSLAGTMKDGTFWPKMQSRLELLPEEALYLVERGSLECRLWDRRRTRSATINELDMRNYNDAVDDEGWVSMSVEQAYATMIGADGLTRSRYQLYAYLRRLGYIVQRKSISDALRTSSLAAEKGTTAQTKEELHAEGIIQDPRHPLRLVTIFDVLFYPMRRILQLAGTFVSHLANFTARLLSWLHSLVRRATVTAPRSDFRRPGGLLGIGAGSCTSFEELYDRLRIVPTGHDERLPEQTSVAPVRKDLIPEIFFYAWRPATLFKKSDPPLPEYQLAVVDARQTSLPSAFAFADLFEHIPIPFSKQDWEQMDEDEQRIWKKAEEQKKRNDESYGRGAVRKRQAAEREAKAAQKGGKDLEVQKGKTTMQRAWRRLVGLLIYVARFFAHLPPGCTPTRGKGRKGDWQRTGRTSGVNVYGPLKAGRRNVIVAVNDCGTTSLLRFGEAEFARWRIAGSGKEGR